MNTDGDHLWVADTTRHRVLCFSLASGAVLAQFGEMDKAGSDLAHVDSPEVLAGRGRRAVVFDRGNQRLVKLILTE